MNHSVAFPFLTLSDAAVEATPWQYSLDASEWKALGDHVVNWDPSSNLNIRRIIRLNPEAAASELQIPLGDLRISMSVRVGTGLGRLPRMIVDRQRHQLGPDSWQHEFACDLPGRSLSAILHVDSEVTLVSTPERSGPLSPRTSADRLWTSRERVRLEGEEPRFPIETIDLSRLLGNSLAASAPWHLHWSPLDWNRDLHGAIRLYLNEKHAELLERAETQDRLTLQAVMADVMSQICERFLLDADALETAVDAEPGSLGAQARRWLRQVWPGRDIASIRSVLEHRPGDFRSAFLSLADLGEV